MDGAMRARVVEYYDAYDELGRLERDNAHRIEFLTTVSYFDKLIKPGSTVLDVCAGTGAYAFYLAAKGCEVTACDLSPHNVDIIKAHPRAHTLTDILVCDALDLSRFAAASYDTVLCMGALYHLKGASDKTKAIGQCVRVTKRDGLVALTYINKFAIAVWMVNADLSNMDEIERYGEATHEDVFQYSAPGEIRAMAERCGLETLYNIGADGMTYALGGRVNNASEENFARWMEYHLATCEEPSILGASVHGLYIGKRKGGHRA